MSSSDISKSFKGPQSEGQGRTLVLGLMFMVAVVLVEFRSHL